MIQKAVQALWGLRLTMLLTNRSKIHHFTCDVTVTSFHMGMKPNFKHPSFMQVCVRMSSFPLLPLRVAKILRGRNGGNMPPPPPSGWRVVRRPSGRRVNWLFISARGCSMKNSRPLLRRYSMFTSHESSSQQTASSPPVSPGPWAHLWALIITSYHVTRITSCHVTRITSCHQNRTRYAPWLISATATSKSYNETLTDPSTPILNSYSPEKFPHIPYFIWLALMPSDDGIFSLTVSFVYLLFEHWTVLWWTCFPTHPSIVSVLCSCALRE